MRRFSIMVMEYGSDHETDLISTRLSRIGRYSSIRIVDNQAKP